MFTHCYKSQLPSGKILNTQFAVIKITVKERIKQCTMFIDHSLQACTSENSLSTQLNEITKNFPHRARTMRKKRKEIFNATLFTVSLFSSTKKKGKIKKMLELLSFYSFENKL